MAPKDQQRAQAAQRLKQHLLETGLSQSSLRQLAAAAGISDRMLLYYFDDKSDALNEAFGLIASDLMETLNGGDWDNEIEAKLVAAVEDFKATGSW